MWTLVIDLGLVGAGVCAVVVTAWALQDSIRAEAAIWALRQNGARRRVARARIIRDTCRLVAALAILVAGVHVMAVDAALLVCAMVMLVTIGVDAYARRVITRGDK